MIDVKTALRTAYYSLLNGQLTYGSTGVPVSDTIQKLGAGASIYVLLINEGGQSDNTHQSFMMQEQMRIDIIARGTRVSTAIVDNVAGQILALVLPSPQGNGLPVQPSISIINARVTNDNYQNFKADGAVNVARRMITVTQLVTPGAAGSAYIPPGQAQFIFNEVPTGLINGSNNIYTLAYKYKPGSTELYINGLRQTLNLHYTESSATQITIVDPPQTGDTVQVDYISQP